jgi:tetraacyldisaccharide 4'-kinase
VNHNAFTTLIAAKQRGIVPTLQRCGLSALSLAYGAAVHSRNRAFDRGWKKSHRAAVPVVSVGNVTTGGTGKTPLVAWLANWFRERGVNIALLSRGYRALGHKASRGVYPLGAIDSPHDEVSDAGGDKPPRSRANDEKLVLDKLCPGVPHVQQPDRVAGAKIAVEQHGAQLLILDDGFQHRRLHRDLDIVLIDALNPFGYGRLLPRGLLREPLTGLRRADVIVLTRADQCTAAEKDAILATIRRFAPDCNVAEIAFRPTGVINSAGETRTFSELKSQSVIAFCGVGNPESFRRTLSEYEIREFRPFPDHRHYTAADLDELAQLADATDSSAFVATLKDLVKIDRTELAGRPLWAVQIGTEFLSGRDIVERALAGLVDRAQQPT